MNASFYTDCVEFMLIEDCIDCSIGKGLQRFYCMVCKISPDKEKTFIDPTVGNFQNPSSKKMTLQCKE